MLHYNKVNNRAYKGDCVMRVYENVSVNDEKVQKVLCNCCGKEITKQQGYFCDHLHIEKQWGYFSEKDGRQDKFDLCESCYDKIVNGFVIPIS